MLMSFTINVKTNANVWTMTYLFLTVLLDLKRKFYMQYLEEYVVSRKENHVCLLKKSLYDLKQSPRE
ncbi:hypothetical protein CR513_55854, partial [Mucuna pruriens]